MKLKFKSFADAGDFPNERIVFTALGDIDVGDYALLRSIKKPTGKVTAGNKSAYWFPDKPVKSGDLIVLYTKKGAHSEKQLNDDKKAYFFYWGLGDAVWSAADDYAAVLLHVDEWTSHSPNKD